MSHIGKKPVEVPSGVKVELNGQALKVTGPKGELSREVVPQIVVEIKDDQLLFTIKKEDKISRERWGTERALAQNMITGVSEGFERKLRLEGVGYRASGTDKKVELKLGFSHEVFVEAPEDITFEVKEKVITVRGISKEKVNQIAAEIRAIRKPNVYTGKGVRYDGEVVKLKAGKKAGGE